MKYSLIETEKRWIADEKLLPDLSQLKKIEVRDKYYPGTRTRLRKMHDTSSGESVYKFTKKYGKTSGYTEPLTTIYLSENEFEMFDKLEGKHLIKNVYHYYFNEIKFLIEVFIKPETGFVLIEAEASDEDALNKIVPPEFAVKDVTAIPVYEGYSIAMIESLVVSI